MRHIRYGAEGRIVCIRTACVLTFSGQIHILVLIFRLNAVVQRVKYTVYAIRFF